jgi:hypothetical protein
MLCLQRRIKEVEWPRIKIDFHINEEKLSKLKIVCINYIVIEETLKISLILMRHAQRMNQDQL